MFVQCHLSRQCFNKRNYTGSILWKKRRSGMHDRFTNVGSEESAMNIVTLACGGVDSIMHDAMAYPNYIADLNT